MIQKIALFGALAALLFPVRTLSAQDTRPVPPKVFVASPSFVSEANPKRYPGVVEAIRRVDLMPRVTGVLWKTHFKEGEVVKEGTLLYELEDTTYKAAVSGLEAQLEQTRASLKYAESEYGRNTTLLESKAVSVSTHDKSVMEIAVAKAQLKNLTALLSDACNTLSYTRIHAPLSGRIGKNVYVEGSLITPNGGKLNDIEMIAPIYVKFSLSERVFRGDFGGEAGIRTNAAVRLRLADGTLFPETAQVTLVDNKMNASTDTITLWATFPNADHKLIAGSFVTVLISAKSEKEFVTVSPSALIADADSSYYVFVLDEQNKVSRRNVKVGGTAGDRQIVLSGLSGNERVIVDGMHKVREGMIVDPVPYPEEKAK